MSKLQKTGIFAGAIIVLVIIGLFLFRLFFVDVVDNYEQGYKYDMRTGDVTVLAKRGWIVTMPILVQVNTVDLRPVQVCISPTPRVLNCKLVKFNPDGLELFLSWHGRGDYAHNVMSNRDTNFTEILKSYSYDGLARKYPFLTIIRELKPEATEGMFGDG